MKNNEHTTQKNSTLCDFPYHSVNRFVSCREPVMFNLFISSKKSSAIHKTLRIIKQKNIRRTKK
jgi:hypothetical protein